MNIITNRETSVCFYGIISLRKTYRKDFPQIQMGGEDESHIYSSRPPADWLLYECYTPPSSTIYFTVFVIGKAHDVGWYYFVIHKFNSILIQEAVTWKKFRTYVCCRLFKGFFFLCTVRNWICKIISKPFANRYSFFLFFTLF